MSGDTLRHLLTAAGYAATAAGVAAAAAPGGTEPPGQAAAGAVPLPVALPSFDESELETGPAVAPAMSSSARAVRLNRLRRLAMADGIEQADDLLTCIDAADLAALHGLDDRVLTAYLRARQARAEREAGLVPSSYTERGVCAGCGPVWLWPGAGRVVACPWCWERRAGRPVPAPVDGSSLSLARCG